MFITIVGAGAVEAEAASCYGSSSDKMMWLLAAPAPQHCFYQGICRGWHCKIDWISYYSIKILHIFVTFCIIGFSLVCIALLFKKRQNLFFWFGLVGLVVFLFQLIAVILAFVLRNNIETDFNKVSTRSMFIRGCYESFIFPFSYNRYQFCILCTTNYL
jgi:hypothetical protein